MPIIEITLVEGRSDEKKEALIKAVTDATEQSIGAPPEIHQSFVEGSAGAEFRRRRHTEVEKLIQ